MKYLFLQRSGLPWHGLMSISAQLKQEGHDTMLLMADEEKRNIYYLTRKFKPDYLLMPVITGEHDWVRTLSNELYDKVELVLGGPHATFYPETLPYADYVIRGEADFLGTLLRRQEPGVYTMQPPDSIVPLPEPDRNLYYQRYPYLAKASSKQFLTARGCPFNCTFCSNHLTHRMFPDTPLIRRKTPEQVFAEIFNTMYWWGLKTVSFSDDVFTLDKKWLTRFLLLYKSHIRLPFICNTRFDIFDEELADMLMDAGCYGIEMGVESGVQELRSKVLGKGDKPNEAILKAAVIAKSRGLKLKTYNIIGIPGETFEDAMQTVKLNQQLKADQTSCSFMTPFPGYAISEHYAEELDWKSGSQSIYQPGKWIPRELVNLQTFFLMLVKFPWLEGVVRRLCRVKPNKLFRLVALGMYGLFMAKVHRLTVGDIWRYVRHIKPERI